MQKAFVAVSFSVMKILKLSKYSKTEGNNYDIIFNSYTTSNRVSQY